MAREDELPSCVEGYGDAAEGVETQQPWKEIRTAH